MEKQILQSVSSKEGILNAVAFYKKITDEHLKHNRNDFWPLDRYSAYHYFERIPKGWKHKVINYFSEVRKAMHQIVHVDICGRASGEDLGAHKSYCFSLKTPKAAKSSSSEATTFVEGNIFDADDFNNFVKVIKKNRVSPSFVTFVPFAGLDVYSWHEDFKIHESSTYMILRSRLKAIIRILKPGGYILLQQPFQMVGLDYFFKPQKSNSKLNFLLQKFVIESNCTFQVYTGTGLPYFFIRKSLL